MFSHLLFDLDGTLTDPAPGILRSLRYALDKLGIVEEDDGTLIRFIGPPLKDSFSTVYSLNEQAVNEAIEYYRQHHGETGLYENAAYPGIEALLAQLNAEGKTLYIATTKLTAFAEKVLEHFGLARYFSLVIGGHPDGTRTDKREIIGEILASIPQEKHQNTVMIGDRKFDIAGARAHGITAVAVTYGYGSIEELASEQPDYIVGSVAGLQDLLSGKSQNLNKI